MSGAGNEIGLTDDLARSLHRSFPVINFQITIIRTVAQPATGRSGMNFINDFFSGSVSPGWPHFWLLAIALLGSAAVAWGIIKEAERIWSLTTLLVVGGVAVEAICTFLLFEFDEGISGKQQIALNTATDRLRSAREEIASLNAQIEPRDLSVEEASAIVAAVSRFAGREVAVQSYMGDTEGHRLLFRVSQILGSAGLRIRPGYWYPDTSPAMQFLLGMEVDAPANEADLAEALVRAFQATKLSARGWFPAAWASEVTIHIGVKPFPIPANPNP
jgi:hypothetical protein